MESFDDGLRGSSTERGVIPFRRASTALTAIDVVHRDVQEPVESGFSIRDFIAMLIRRAWVIAGVAAVVMAIVVVSTLMQQPMFRASATLEVQRQETQIIEGGAVQPATVADSEHMATQYALLRSRALAERVAETLDLPSDPRYANPKGGRTERLNQATSTIMRGLTVLPVQRSRVIELRFHSPYPAEAARLATAFAENFIQNDLERRYNTTAYARTFLEERLATTKAALEDAERKLVSYSRDQNILDLGSGDAATPGGAAGASLDATSLIALNASLTQAQDARITAEQRFNEARSNAATRETLASPAINTLSNARAELSAEYQQKLRTFKPDYPEMKDIKARMDAIDGEIQSERGKILGALEAEYRAAVSREAALQRRVNQLKSDVQDVRTRSIDYNILSREVDTLRSQYNALLQRFKEVSIVGGIGESRVSIVDRAEAPKSPFEPDLNGSILRGLVLALGLGIGLALLLEYIDDTIKTPDDVKTKLGLAMIGVIPKIAGKQTVLEMLEDPRSSVSEAFSSARTALQFTTPTGAPRSLLITGMRPSEGKTSTATGLALAFAGIGKSVLIIDADMRRPSFVADPGASSGLSGLLTRDIALQDHIVAGKVENVHLLPSGVTPPNPAELLSSPRFARLLEEAKEAYDIVVVDAPPVLDFADAPLLSSVCECTVVVMQAGGVRRPNARRTIERLLASKANIVGAILTKFDLQRTGYGYGYDYSYQYGGYRNGDKGMSKEISARRRVSIFTSSDRPDGPSSEG